MNCTVLIIGEQTYLKGLPGWLVKSQLVIHSPESNIEYFVLPRVENNKVIGVADEDAPEEPRSQQPIELRSAGIFLGVCECEEGDPGDFEWADLQVLRRHGRIRMLCSI